MENSKEAVSTNFNIIDESIKGKRRDKKYRKNQKTNLQSNSSQSAASTCPHANGNGIPVCWDCAEEGHIRTIDGVSSSGGGSPRNFKKHSRRQGGFSSWDGSTLADGSTWRGSSILPEWHPPEPGLEARYPNGISTPEDQSAAPEWHPPESGLEVVQPASAEKIPLPQKRRILNHIFGAQKKWGLRRRTLCWILLCAVLLIIALVLGVVLGLILKAHDSSGTSTPTTTSDPSTTTASMGAPSIPTLSGMPSCPNANGTTYTDPSTKEQFRRECGIAHNGSNVSHHIAYSMDDCVASCAQSSICMGVVWTDAGAQGYDNNWCWLHSDMSQEEYVRIDQYAQSATRVM